MIKKAERNVNKANGKLVYEVMYEIYDQKRDREGKLYALGKSLQYGGYDKVTKHKFGVELSRAGKTEDAIKIFTEIIEEESKYDPPHDTLILALSTRSLNYKRLSKMELYNHDRTMIKNIVKNYPFLSGLLREFE